MKRFEPSLFAEGFMFLEAPRWHDGQLWVSDVFDQNVYALSSKGQRATVIDVPNRPSRLGFLSDGSLIIASAKDSRLLRFDRTQQRCLHHWCGRTCSRAPQGLRLTSSAANNTML
jgi:sugar lactone lactonase YvrE